MTNKNQKNKGAKTPKQLERYFKGVANHHRIAILFFVEKNPGVTLETIAHDLQMNFKTASSHALRLKLAGLLNKQYYGVMIKHTLSPYGKKFVRFLKSF